jgi:hypothetical protein
MITALTGHQDLGGTNVESWLASVLDKWLASHKVELGLTCLAAGADQLFAECLLRQGIPFNVTVPCKGYEKAFKSEESRKRYHKLLACAQAFYVEAYEHPSEEAFFSAGKRIVTQCDMLIAIWDGQKSHGLGGTADIVEYAASLQKPIFHINPRTHLIDQH